jgi:phosphonate transport system permease protein
MKTSVQLLAWLRRSLLFIGATVILAWAWRGAELDPGALWANLGNSLEFARGFMAPNLSEWREISRQLVVTLQMALWGTLLAVVGAAPLSLAAINEMVFAFIFMVAVGLGPFAGTLALFFHTTGVLGKLFSEAVESIDPRPVEGIRAAGASRLAEIVWGVLPQVYPLWVSYALYRFESNVRSATVVGIVGAGGIGFLLNEHFRTYEYDTCSTIMLLIILTVVALDLLSARLRRLASGGNG